MVAKRPANQRLVSRRRLFSVLGNAFRATGRAVVQEAKPDLRPSRLGKMSRRELLARALVGAGMIAVARWYGKAKILEAVFPQSKYQVDFAFLTHKERAHADQLRSLIETAIREGKPFHCVSIESPTLRGQESKFEQVINGGIKDFQQQIKGKTPQEVVRMEETVFRLMLKNMQSANSENPLFTAQLLTICFRYGLVVKAGEKYNLTELEKEKELHVNYAPASKKIEELVAVLKQNPNSPNKSELIRQLRHTIPQFVRGAADTVRYRNDFIRRTTVGLQEELRNEFPALKNKKPLRVLYVAGSAHEKLFEDASIENYREFEAKKHVFAGSGPTLNRLIQRLVRFPNSKISDAELEQVIGEFLSN